MSEGQNSAPMPLPPSEPVTRLASFIWLADYRLRLTYDDGHVCDADLAQRADAPADHDLFHLAHINFEDNALGWPGIGERIDASTLRQLAEQQAEEPELWQFWQRLADSALSLEQVAAAWGFGISHSPGYLQR